MKHIWMIAIVVALAAAACKPKEEAIYTAPDGTKVTSSQEGDHVTMTDNKGNSVELGSAVTEADLGVPFYPGSAEEPKQSLKLSEGEKKSILSVRTTKDDPAKVTEFYKDKITDPKPSGFSSGDTALSMLTGKLKDGSEVVITVEKKDKEDTKISVAVNSKK